MTIIEKAKIQRENIVKAMQSLDDKEASLTPELFGTLVENGELITAGTKINWNGTIKKAAVGLWDTFENNPDNAPTLWQDIEYKDGYRIIPDIITVSTKFDVNEYGWWRGVLYKSLVDNNVYTPVEYPYAWEQVQ